MDNPVGDLPAEGKKSFWQSILSSRSRTLGFLAILIIIASIPLTVIISQQQQQTKQHAAGTTCTFTGTNCSGAYNASSCAGLCGSPKSCVDTCTKSQGTPDPSNSGSYIGQNELYACCGSNSPPTGCTPKTCADLSKSGIYGNVDNGCRQLINCPSNGGCADYNQRTPHNECVGSTCTITHTCGTDQCGGSTDCMTSSVDCSTGLTPYNNLSQFCNGTVSSSVDGRNNISCCNGTLASEGSGQAGGICQHDADCLTGLTCTSSNVCTKPTTPQGPQPVTGCYPNPTVGFWTSCTGNASSCTGTGYEVITDFDCNPDCCKKATPNSQCAGKAANSRLNSTSCYFCGFDGQLYSDDTYCATNQTCNKGTCVSKNNYTCQLTSSGPQYSCFDGSSCPEGYTIANTIGSVKNCISGYCCIPNQYSCSGFDAATGVTHFCSTSCSAPFKQESNKKYNTCTTGVCCYGLSTDCTVGASGEANGTLGNCTTSTECGTNLTGTQSIVKSNLTDSNGNLSTLPCSRVTTTGSCTIASKDCKDSTKTCVNGVCTAPTGCTGNQSKNPYQCSGGSCMQVTTTACQSDSCDPTNPTTCTTATVAVNGACGVGAKAYSSTETAFSGAFCSTGTASPASPTFPAVGASTTWTCQGSGGGSNANCPASRASTTYYVCAAGACSISASATSYTTMTSCTSACAANSVSGACGPLAKSFSSSDTTWPDSTWPNGLCSVGNSSPVSPTFPAAGASTAWSCQGSGGGTNASCTASRQLAGNMTLAFTLGLDGIGAAGDQLYTCASLASCTSTKSPKRSVSNPRDLQVFVYDIHNNLVVNKQSTTLTYGSSTGLFTGSLSVNLTPGSYTIKASSSGYLRKLIPGIQNLVAGTNNISSANLTNGDIDGDNVLTIYDYNRLLNVLNSCPSATSSFPTIGSPNSFVSTNGGAYCNANPNDVKFADLDDNGYLDISDYNLFLREFKGQNGD